MNQMPASSLFAAAECCLAATSPEQKVVLTRTAAAEFRAGRLSVPIGDSQVDAIGSPGRPPRPELIDPRKLAQRGLGSPEGRALVPRVLEARGLDVTPGMIQRLRSVGDHRTADILEVILREEVAHVAAGSRWFAWCCVQSGVEPESTFAKLLDRHMRGSLRGPFNIEARLSAGFSHSELAHLGTLAA